MPKTLGELVDDLHDKREELRDVQREEKRIRAEKEEIELKIAEACKEQGLDQVRGELATATFKTTKVPTVRDWDKVYRYVKQHSAFYLLERRMSVTAWREEVEARKGKALPGVEAFEKESVTLVTRK